MRSGGAERNTYFTIKGLDKEKYQVDLVIGGESEVIPKDLEINVIKINSLKRNINLISEIRAFFKLYKLIKESGYHLVHTHQSKAGMLGRLSAKMARTPIIVHTLHGPLFYPNLNPISRWIYQKLEKFSARYTDWFISVGEDLKNYYLKAEVGKPEKYSIIRSGMSLEKFRQAARFSENEIVKIKKRLGPNLGDPIVGMVAALERRKGYQYAIQVAREIVKKHPRVKFLFVGEGNFRSPLEKIVERTGLKDSIIFTGFRKDVERIMACFDILILSSLAREGLPQVLVQGAILGKPIVSFDVFGASELIKENGFIVPLKDTKAMIQKIDYLLSDLERAKIIGEKGKNLVNENWEIETMVKKINQLYEALFDSKGLKGLAKD